MCKYKVFVCTCVAQSVERALIVLKVVCSFLSTKEHIRYVLLISSQNKVKLFSWLLTYLYIHGTSILKCFSTTAKISFLPLFIYISTRRIPD